MKGSEFESHLDVIQMMLSNGADEFHQRMESVASQGQIDIDVSQRHDLTGQCNAQHLIVI